MRRSLIFAVFLSFAPVAAADGVKVGFIYKTFRGPDGVEAKYAVFVPHNYDPVKKTPTILYLHGSGLVGTDGIGPSNVGICRAIREREKSFPFLVVIPQAQKRERVLLETWYPGRSECDRALAILDAEMKTYNGDPQRLCLTGQSMGGFGTWKLAQAFPKKWAAIVPICGGGDPAWVATIKDIPCWCFHGDNDSTVPVYRSRSMIETLKKAGANPKYDEYPGVGHNSWDKAYATDALYTWLLEQKLK